MPSIFQSHLFSPHFSQSFVARPFKCRPIRLRGLKRAAGILDSMSKSLGSYSHLKEQGLIGWMVQLVRMNRPQQEVCEKYGLVYFELLPIYQVKVPKSGGCGKIKDHNNASSHISPKASRGS